MQLKNVNHCIFIKYVKLNILILNTRLGRGLKFTMSWSAHGVQYIRILQFAGGSLVSGSLNQLEATQKSLP